MPFFFSCKKIYEKGLALVLLPCQMIWSGHQVSGGWLSESLVFPVTGNYDVPAGLPPLADSGTHISLCSVVLV